MSRSHPQAVSWKISDRQRCMRFPAEFSSLLVAAVPLLAAGLATSDLVIDPPPLLFAARTSILLVYILDNRPMCKSSSVKSTPQSTQTIPYPL